MSVRIKVESLSDEVLDDLLSRVHSDLIAAISVEGAKGPTVQAARLDEQLLDAEIQRRRAERSGLTPPTC